MLKQNSKAGLRFYEICRKLEGSAKLSLSQLLYIACGD